MKAGSGSPVLAAVKLDPSSARSRWVRGPEPAAERRGPSPGQTQTCGFRDTLDWHLHLAPCSLQTEAVHCDPDALLWVGSVFGLWTMVEEMEGKDKPRPGPDYLMQLMNDKKLMSSLPNFSGIFQHLERLLDEGKKSLANTQVRVCHWMKRDLLRK